MGDGRWEMGDGRWEIDGGMWLLLLVCVLWLCRELLKVGKGIPDPVGLRSIGAQGRLRDI